MRHFFLVCVLLAGCGISPNDAKEAANRVAETASTAATDVVKLAAGKVYDQAKARRLTLDHGPCLSEDFVRGWSLDIVHVPRTPEDDLPENQCAAHREGRTRLIELDADGAFVGIR